MHKLNNLPTVAFAMLWCSALKCCSNDRYGITDCLKYFIVLAQVRLHVWKCKLNRVEVWGEYGGRKIFQLLPFPLPSLPLTPLPLIPPPPPPPTTTTTSSPLCGVWNTFPLQQQNYQHLHQNSASVESGFHEQSLQLTRLAVIVATTIVCTATPQVEPPILHRGLCVLTIHVHVHVAAMAHDGVTEGRFTAKCYLH